MGGDACKLELHYTVGCEMEAKEPAMLTVDKANLASLDGLAVPHHPTSRVHVMHTLSTGATGVKRFVSNLSSR